MPFVADRPGAAPATASVPASVPSLVHSPVLVTKKSFPRSAWNTSGTRLQMAFNTNAHMGLNNNWNLHAGGTLDGLGEKPDLVVLELGANDMLRSLDPALTERNLDAMLAELKRREVPVLLAGMRATRNLDPGFVERFEAIYPRLAAKHGVAFYPFFLDGAALVPGMMQDDQMHPTFEGVKQVTTRITPSVKAALGR